MMCGGQCNFERLIRYAQRQFRIYSNKTISDLHPKSDPPPKRKEIPSEISD